MNNTPRRFFIRTQCKINPGVRESNEVKNAFDRGASLLNILKGIWRELWMELLLNNITDTPAFYDYTKNGRKEIHK